MNNKKAEELIAYLICQKDSSCSKSNAASLLWPNSDNCRALNSLYKVLEWFRTQKSLYLSTLIEYPRGKLYLNRTSIQCDLWDFDFLYSNKSIQNWEHAARLYNGILYYEDAYSWAAMYDGKYDMKYLEIIEYLYDYYTKKGNIKKAGYYNHLSNM